MYKRYEDQNWKDTMKIKLDYNNMMDTFLQEEGICYYEEIEKEKTFEFAKNNLEKKIKEGKISWQKLPYNQKNIIEEIKNYVLRLKNNIEYFIILGIGGSALGPLAVHNAINHPFYNELSKKDRNNLPKFYVLDNIDPEKLSYLFNIIDIKKCLFNIISKSGNTIETISQFMIISKLLKDKLNNYKDNIVCTTDEKNGTLIEISKKEGFKTFIIPNDVGGRFSQLTPVGLLPAAFCGINIEELLAGAKYMDKLCQSSNINNNISYMYSILNFLAFKKGKNITVLMPYVDRLKFISKWFCQLWAESLGKKYDLENNEVYTGQTPISALGATDQHSQLQLYKEGPFDKVITFITVDNYKKTLTIPSIYENSNLDFLFNVTQNDLIKSEQLATEYSLTKSKKMNMKIILPEINEFTIGQLLYMFEMSTAFMGELLNINAFDQPGVEESKAITYALFNKPGYENKKLELECFNKKYDKFII